MLSYSQLDGLQELLLTYLVSISLVLRAPFRRRVDPRRPLLAKRSHVISKRPECLDIFLE